MFDVFHSLFFQEISNNIVIVRITGRAKYDMMFPGIMTSSSVQKKIAHKFDDIVTYNVSAQRLGVWCFIQSQSERIRESFQHLYVLYEYENYNTYFSNVLR